VILDFYNEAGQLAISYKIYRCWVSEYQALPDLDANANAVAIQHIKQLSGQMTDFNFFSLVLIRNDREAETHWCKPELRFTPACIATLRLRE
jgi:hypothetical protein